MDDSLVPFQKLPIEVGRMTLSRWIAAGQFPAPAHTICNRRYWSASDVQLFIDGKRDGWAPDANAANRRRVLLERMHGRTRWAEAIA
jgi:hypothetical protein